MKLQRLLIGMLLAMLAAVSVGQPEDAQLRKDMEGFFHRVDKLISTNSPQLWSVFHPGYVSVDTQGKRMNLGEFKSAMKSGMAGTKDLTTKMTVKHVRRHQNEAAVWVEEVVTYKVRQSGRWAAKKSTTRWAETLVWTEGGWKFMYSQALPTNEPWPFKVG